MTHRAEFPYLGVVLMEYRDAVQIIDGCLTTAKQISAEFDPDKAASILACHEALLQALDVVDGLLEDRRRKDS